MTESNVRLAKALNGHTVEQLTAKILRRYEDDVPSIKQFLRDGEDLVLLQRIRDLEALALRTPSDGVTDEMVERAARAIAYDEWSLATDQERQAWSDKHWASYLPAAKSALASAWGALNG